MPVHEAFERPAKLAKATRWCKNFSDSSSTAAFSALFVEQDEFKSRCRALSLEKQRMLRLAAETKGLRVKVTKSGKIVAVMKNTSKCRRNKRSTAASREMIPREAQVAQAVASHAQLFNLAAQCYARTEDA